MTEENKAVVARVFTEIFNNHRLDLVPECYTDDCEGFDPANQGNLSGHEALIELINGYRAAFPDHYYELHELAAEGDLVCVRWTVKPKSEKLSKDFKVEGLSLCHFRDGKISKVWQHWDDLGFLKEAGAVSRLVNIADAVRNLIDSN